MLNSLIGIIASSGAGAVVITGGNEIKTVGSYKYHIFTANGTFSIVGGSQTVEVTACGGGGATGFSWSGGGGGGEISFFEEVFCKNEAATTKAAARKKK